MKAWIKKLTLKIKIRFGWGFIISEDLRNSLPAGRIPLGGDVIGFDTEQGRYVQNSVLAVEKIKVKRDDFYIINEEHFFYKNQSLLLNDKVCHAFQVTIGDTLKGLYGQTIKVNSVRRVTQTGYFYRMTIGTNHTYFVNGVMLHNASRFWVGGAASWNGTAGSKWSGTSGGGGGSSIPTSSDDAFLDAASGAVAVTIATGHTNCASLDCTGFTGTLAGSAAMSVFSNLTFVAGMTRSYTGVLTFAATTTGKTITLNGKTFGAAVTFNGSGGGWTLQDNFSLGSSTLTLTTGTLDTNGKTVTAGQFISTGSGTRALTLGASAINLSSNWNFTSTGMTFTAGTSTITFSATNQFTGAGLTYNNVVFNDTPQVGIDGANTFANLTINRTSTGFAGLKLNANQTVTTLLTCGGASTIARVYLWGAQSGDGVQKTITAASVSLNNVNFQDINGAGAASWTGTSIGDCGNNANITFDAQVTRYWRGNGGNFNDTAHWATSSGGAGGNSVPLPQDLAKFDSNSFSSGSQTIGLNGHSQLCDIDFTGVTNTPTFQLMNSVSPYVIGNLKLVSGMAISGTLGVTMSGRSDTTLTTGGLTFASASMFIQKGSATCFLGDSLTQNGAVNFFRLDSGTFDANNFNVTLNGASSNLTGTNASATLKLGSGTWTLGGTSPWSFSGILDAGTSTILVGENSASTKFFTGGGKTFYNLKWTTQSTGNLQLSGNNTFNQLWVTGSGTGALLLTGSNSITDFKVDTPPHTITFTAGTTQTIAVGGWNMRGTAGNLIRLQSTTSTNFNLSMATAVVNSDYLNISDSSAAGGATWFAGANSTNSGGGNTGWIFTDPTVTLNETVILVDTISKLTSKVVNEIVTLVDTVTKTISKSLSDEIPLVDTISKQGTFFRTFDEVVTLVASLTNTVVKSFSEAIVLVDTATAKVVAKILNEVVQIVDTATTGAVLHRSYNEIVTLVDTIAKMPGKMINDALTPVDTFTRVGTFKRSLNEVVTLVLRFQGLINGLDISWIRKYANQAGVFTRKYANQAGNFIKKYLDIP